MQWDAVKEEWDKLSVKEKDRHGLCHLCMSELSVPLQLSLLLVAAALMCVPRHEHASCLSIVPDFLYVEQVRIREGAYDAAESAMS